ncbi:MAG: twin-arginine translocase subunit TatB [Candidatus Accumulibacter sp.]|uniref:Sec-independent protein translocase protein TatB n=1 Tax=Accumulibacter sp. TaxID=2053492 RepID=UPI001A61D019|nr:Sec-independent protein translocase protein TatB [Accumulibacter sp.]MBL8391506.1 twin-arginine translocase subunit TatB [Accumulibacter sp.]HRD86897.1 Sec-independent protein translocase protein TatB [Accumulibacter sp.]
MFDIGFSELMLIAVVALVVIGPERLPRVARTAGHLLGRLQRYVSTVKSDISREMQLEELRRLQSEIQQSARSVEEGLSSEMQAAKQALAVTAEAVNSEINAPPASAPAPSVAHSPVAPPLPADLPGASADRSGPGTSS